MTTIDRIAAALEPVACVRAVVLGGSRATGTATAHSDLDIGIYYDSATLDLDGLNAAARALDDAHRENLICPEGGWGPWVNCGGWLTVDGMPTDLILRDVHRVERVIDETDHGEVASHYQTGHPHAFVNVMYRGELALCQPLWTRGDFPALKARAEVYPEPMRESLLGAFGFEMGFSAGIAEKSLSTGDSCYVTGHLFRAASAMHQVMFALNRAYCLNEKRASQRVEALPLHPENYARRASAIFEVGPEEGVRRLNGLRTDVERMLQEER